ncbi:DUF1178 family protein [Aurantimonas sp. 22II-16-19i]|uniref:DUF1178 family protein n=1 Tax=Aurantimonas sp. 22II-16-19i TaxID=1317114 RepID=UPI0009F7A12E|nr:DUF1178 family protein [Aurantimonas sp. 22II-16-19i]ORE97701.1 hypothetical protein ATO4_07175 [Aurantimonas sp. 22II-16-19i]
MIHFQLRCRPSGHSFDGWFRSSDDFARQAGEGFVECPVCGAREVEKALMRPAIAKAGAAGRAAAEALAESAAAARRSGDAEGSGPPAGAAAAPAALDPQPPRSLAHLPAPSPEVARAFAVLQEISRKVRAEADYVGEGFAEEARRIHYGESEARQIYGEASKKDVESLKEEGIAALPLMPLPEDGQ